MNNATVTKVTQKSISQEQRRKRFLKAMAQFGTVSAGSDAAGIARKTAYQWRKTDPAFASAWDQAMETCLDSIEQSLVERGRKKSDRAAIAMLKARRRNVWGDRVQVDLAPIEFTYGDEDE